MFLTRGNSAPCSVKVADFGIAKVLEENLAETLCGTPYYFSPEICQFKPYDSSADIWALGCVLFQLCTQMIPFDAESIGQLKIQICRGPLPEPPPGYSCDVGAFVAAMLQRSVADRPSAATMLKGKRLQQEIRTMYEENHRGREENVAPLAEQLCSPRKELKLSARNRSPSPLVRNCNMKLQPLGLREASPHRTIAKEVLRPSNVATPRIR